MDSENDDLEKDGKGTFSGAMLVLGRVFPFK